MCDMFSSIFILYSCNSSHGFVVVLIFWKPKFSQVYIKKRERESLFFLNVAAVKVSFCNSFFQKRNKTIILAAILSGVYDGLQDSMD